MPFFSIPWPDENAEFNPPLASLEEGASFAAVRLSFALCRLRPYAALHYLRLALACAARLDIAELTLAERNIALPAHWVFRAAFRAHPGFWRGGAFWGLARQANLEPQASRPILGGAATLATFAGARREQRGERTGLPLRAGA